MTQLGPPDWGDGAYESFSVELAPAAAHLVDVAAVLPGEQAVDLGCGDGNATTLLAATGARVTGVDPATRLLEVAARRCAEAGQEVVWMEGSSESLPLPDDSVDVVISNFGVIFSAEPTEAIREVLRVLRAGGRFVYSAWRPSGGIAEAAGLVRRLMADRANASAAPDDPPPPPPPWHEPAAWIAELVPGGAAAITVHEGTLDFLADSGKAWVTHQEETHPLWRAARLALDDEPAWRDLMARSAAVLDQHSTIAEAMLVPSPYVIVEVHPKG
ncbi:MAG: class I SAM-dependent methyltransferase [Patulibacter minatonensis]